MTLRRIHRENFLVHRPATALLSRVASTAIRILIYFLSTWLYETSFSALLGKKNNSRNKQIVEQDLWFALAAKARHNRMDMSYHSVILGC